MKHTMGLAVLLLSARLAAADEGPVRITGSRAEGDACALEVEVHSGARLAARDPGFRFGQPLSGPSRSEGNRWRWEALAPGRYELRFVADDHVWIAAIELEKGWSKSVVFRAPSTLAVAGTVADAAGARVSAVSHVVGLHDRVIWKTWSTLGSDGRYRLPILPFAPVHDGTLLKKHACCMVGEPYVAAQTFLDDDRPEVLGLEGRVSAGRFISGELWSRQITRDDAGTVEAGQASARRCGSRLEVRGKARFFVEGRRDFSFLFDDGVDGRPLQWIEVDGALPNGEILVVVSAPDGAHHFRVRIDGGSRTIDAAPPAKARVELRIEGLTYDNEQEFARIRRTVHLLPEEFENSCSPELAEAFGTVLPWKGGRASLRIPEGRFIAWVSSTPWLETSRVPNAPVAEIYAAILAKINSESFESRTLEVRGEAGAQVTFQVRRNR